MIKKGIFEEKQTQQTEINKLILCRKQATIFNFVSTYLRGSRSVSFVLARRSFERTGYYSWSYKIRLYSHMEPKTIHNGEHFIVNYAS